MTATMNETENTHFTKPWDLRDIAEFYGVSIRTVQRWIRSGQLPRPFILGRQKLWMQNQVMEWMQRKGHEAQETQAACNIRNFEYPTRRHHRKKHDIGGTGI